MQVSFDKFDRFEIPQIILCNPSCEYSDGDTTGAIGELVQISDAEIEMNFNSLSTLDFRLYDLQSDDSELYAYTNMLYRSAVNKRYIYLYGIGYFVITDSKEGVQDGNRYKDITATSCEKELDYTLLPFIDGTRPITAGEQDESGAGVLDIILSIIPGWQIGHIDDSLRGLYRTFDDDNTKDDVTVYDFLTSGFQDAYGCIVLFDILNRRIDIYNRDTYLIETEIHLSADNWIKKIETTYSDGDLYTALRVNGTDSGSGSHGSDSGSDEKHLLGISDVNPTGTDLIYNFDYYLSWMSDGLASAVRDWKNAVEQNKSAYKQHSLALIGYNKALFVDRLELTRINTLISLYTDMKTNIEESGYYAVPVYNDKVSAIGGTEVTIHDLVEDTLQEVNNYIAEYTSQAESVQQDIADNESLAGAESAAIQTIMDSTSIQRAFTDAQKKELSRFIFEGTYKNPYIAVSDSMTTEERLAQEDELANAAMSVMASVSKPRYEYSVDVENFIFIHEFQDWTKQAIPGCSVTVETERDEAVDLFLSGITVNYEEKSAKFKFGSQIDRGDLRSLYTSVFGYITRTGNSLRYY